MNRHRTVRLRDFEVDLPKWFLRALKDAYSTARPEAASCEIFALAPQVLCREWNLQPLNANLRRLASFPGLLFQPPLQSFLRLRRTVGSFHTDHNAFIVKDEDEISGMRLELASRRVL